MEVGSLNKACHKTNQNKTNLSKTDKVDTLFVPILQSSGQNLLKVISRKRTILESGLYFKVPMVSALTIFHCTCDISPDQEFSVKYVQTY